MKLEKEDPFIDDFIVRFNAQQKAWSIKEQVAGGEFNSIMLNNPSSLLRNISANYPLTRTCEDFGNALDRIVTIVGKDGKKVDWVAVS